MAKIMQRIFRVGLIVAVLVVAGVGARIWMRHRQAPASVFRVAPVKRGDLVAVIDATGTAEPEEVVDVGAQVLGQIDSFGKDANGKTVDWDSPVEQGTVLAHIDDSLYKAAVEVAQANLNSAKANVLQMKAKLVQAEQDWTRAQKLGPSEALAATLYDQYQATYEICESERRGRHGGSGPSQGGVGLGPKEPRLLHHQLARQRRD